MLTYLATIGSAGACEFGRRGFDRGMEGMGHFGYHAGPPFGGLTLFLALALLFVLILLVVKLFAKKRAFYHHLPTDNALEILKERYVKGEVSADEFKEMKKNLLG